ncbi:MAG: FAD-dependent oxidoreductase [Polyangia bacterium]
MLKSRRRFLRYTGMGLGLGALGTGVFVATHQPKKRILPRLAGDENRPLLSTNPKRVVIVGGGLAGLVAAIELAARKFAVTLVERAGHLGGKLGGWNVTVDGETFPTEHGFHGFFGQYYNLYEHIEAAGAMDNLHAPPDYPVLFADRPEDRYGKLTKLFPLDMLQVVHQSKSMHLTDFVQNSPAILELMRYDNDKTFARFDDVDFWKFSADGRMNQPMRENVIHPFGKTTLNDVDKLSAAEGIRFFHFFFIGNPAGLWYRYTKRDSMSSILDPMTKRLRSLGGTIRLGQGARRFRHEAGRVRGVELDRDSVSGGQVRVAASTVPTTGWTPIAGPDGSAVYVARRADGFVAFDARCTHMGCPVRPDDAGFVCPCHGGRYTADGVPTAGPPQRPLRSLPVVQQGDELLVGDAAVVASGEVLPCDYAISACEVRGTKQLFDRSELGIPALDRRVQSLGEADPFIVYRLWLDKPVAPGRSAFYTCSRFGIVDSLAVYSILQEPYISYARRTGHSVVELHAYAVPPEKMKSADEMAARMIAEMRRIFPELADAKVLHGEYQVQSNFSGFRPGSHRDRPRTETEIENLFIAGDHVRMDAAAALMEAATISGRLAANAILRKEGLREIPISSVPEKGPLA